MKLNPRKFLPGIFCLMIWLLLAFPNPVTAAVTSPQSTKSLTHGKPWAQMLPVEKVQVVGVLLAVLLIFTAEIMFIVAGFKTSVGWGLFMLFIGGLRSMFAALGMLAWMVQWIRLTKESEPFKLPSLILGTFIIFAGSGVIIFIVRHWENARKPVTAFGLGIGLILGAAALQFAK